MASELKRLIEQVSREKGIDRQTLIHTLEEAIKSAIRKKYGSKLDLDVTFNEEYGEIEAFQFKEVVEEVIDPDKQVLLCRGVEAGQRERDRGRTGHQDGYGDSGPDCRTIRQAGHHPEDEGCRAGSSL